MKRYIKYLYYVIRHKWFVFIAGIGSVPIFSLIFHDWDKFLLDEFIPYAHTFYKRNGDNQYNNTIYFAIAWMKHQHRNKHHWQYWLNVNGIPLSKTNVIVWDTGKAQEIKKINNEYVLIDIEPTSLAATEMAYDAVREMLADWQGASRAITGSSDITKWYNENKNKMILHPDTRLYIDVYMDVVNHSHIQE